MIDPNYALGLIASVIAVYEFGERFVKPRKKITWKRVEKRVLKLIDEINAETWTPQLIIGVGRGGSIIAAMLATNLEGSIPIGFVDTVGVQTDAGDPHTALRNPESLPDVAGKNVLVVVAELWTGSDLRVARDHIASLAPATCRSLAVFGSPNRTVQPTYLGEETKYHPIAPWRITPESLVHRQ